MGHTEEMRVGIVSTFYPDPGGVATYTQYLFSDLSRIHKHAYILAPIIKQQPGQQAVQDKVIRCWDRGSILYPLHVWKAARRQKLDVVHIQQELHLFGGKLNAMLVPFLAAMLRLSGMKVVLTAHGIVPLDQFDRQFMEENGYKGPTAIYRLATKLYFSAVCLFPHNVIVHHEKFKRYLGGYYVDTKKVSVIPHGANTPRLVNQREAREKLGLKDKYTFMYFGYITGYKGVDLIVEAAKRMPDDMQFVIVGSMHPRLKDDPAYIRYYTGLKERFLADKRFKVFGYVPESQVNQFFRACDCLVLPYTVCMSSSGPLSLAIANERIVLGSEAFEGYLPDRLLFARDARSLAARMTDALHRRLESELPAILELKREQAWQNVSRETVARYNDIAGKRSAKEEAV